ncbi:hypothetical protein SAMN05444483_10563 [Salegentibacter echinorum]|uniref:Uncharacterized protein n=1 Tax=Salegentibacter echinorum TaxID=1073325 RepID=A0A1M5HAQ8_SALEC|nr:hypothetical protein [Salegentibacter echinorum]SHG13059.1 hypothetical protein SAMN05444483_10563 [Salegentibacter echinorum]
MERSIENIWKEGFQAEEKLSAPVISNLYKRKSKLVIQQIKNRSKKDNLSLIPVALIMFGVLAFIGKALLGLYVVVLISALFFLNKKTLKNLEAIDIKTNTYEYLITYRNQIKNITTKTTWLLGIGLPIAIIPAYWIFFDGTKVMTNFKELALGIEILIVVGMTLVLLLLGVLSYRLSTRMMYARLLERLESTIEDMEELMKNSFGK